MNPPQPPLRSRTVDHLARGRAWLSRALGTDGHERHVILMLIKSTLAATVCWYVADDLWQAQSPAFAPFSAVAIMQVTVYQSLWQSLRYVAAVAVGVLIQGAMGQFVGPHLITFATVTLLALIIGRWRALRTEGSQVATAAMFAFSTYITVPGHEQWGALGQIVALVLTGCAIGTIVNLTLFPPLRHRTAEQGLRALAHATCDVLTDVEKALVDQNLDEKETASWQHRSAALLPLAAQAQDAVSRARESLAYNPRRLLREHRRHGDFTGYRNVVNALERVAGQVGALCRSLTYAQQDQTADTGRGGFLVAYGQVLAACCEVTRQLSALDENSLAEQTGPLREAAQRARSQLDALASHAHEAATPVLDTARPYGTLMAEAVRLVDDLEYACQVLDRSTNSSKRPYAVVEPP
ncbi:aromatic acid exporter family protein [Streptomyces sp. HUAS MG91]|uniref:Aromatic acid exporter family protein n=1 Tax=Streptomyces tabacisoli TaxID=3156398 RepID=A0AAU8IKH1_9ACTN